MRKNTLQALYIVLMGLFIYSCSGLTLPEKIGVKGTVNLPIRAGAANLGSVLRDKIVKVFSDPDGEADPNNPKKNTKVYNVDYGEKQDAQTFCIYIPFEMTEDLNPNNFLKIIDEHINNNISAEPKKINVPPILDPESPPPPIPYPGVYPGGVIPIETIKGLMGITNIEVPLDRIAAYVKYIDFGTSQEDVDLGKGIIGIDINFSKIPPGLAMKVECYEMRNSVLIDPPLFSDGPKELFTGHNIFCNNEPKQLKPNEYQGENKKKLYFKMDLQSIDPVHPESWNPAACGFPGNGIEIKGEMSVIRKWTEAKIDLKNALKASAAIEDNTLGTFPAPDKPLDLSDLGNYFAGEFEFDGLNVKIYMDGTAPALINELNAGLELKARYNDIEEELYTGRLSISQKPIITEIKENYLVKTGEDENGEDIYTYKKKELPRNTANDVNAVEESTIGRIFLAMPENLFFVFKIITDDDLIIHPGTFNNTDSSGSIKTTMMIMLPMTLKAVGEGCAINLPDMFGEDDDLFGRKEPKELFNKGEIGRIRMTVDFADPIFTKGRLFINKDEETGEDLLFPPHGIQLKGKKTELNFTKEQFDIIDKELIYPKIRIEVDDGGMVNIPKDMAIMSIKIEMKGLINVGDL
jgi:hypothetical protein